jgi:hypothetical protein
MICYIPFVCEPRRNPAAFYFKLKAKETKKCRAFRMSESESADFSEVRVQKFRTLKTLRTQRQCVCLLTNLYCKEVKNFEFSKNQIFKYMGRNIFLNQFFFNSKNSKILNFGSRCRKVTIS